MSKNAPLGLVYQVHDIIGADLVTWYFFKLTVAIATASNLTSV